MFDDLHRTERAVTLWRNKICPPYLENGSNVSSGERTQDLTSENVGSVCLTDAPVPNSNLIPNKLVLKRINVS